MSNILDFLTDPAEATEAFHGIIYGPSGCGKTSTLDDDNLKVLLVDMEGGSAVLNGAPNIKRLDVPQIALKTGKLKFEVLVDIGKAVEANKFAEFDLIGMDSMTAFEEIVKEYIALKYAPNRAREIQEKFGCKADWGDLRDLISRNIRWWHSFTKRGDKSQHVMWMAHVLVERDEDTNRATNTKIMLQGSATSEIVMSIVDGFFYMYNKDIIVDKKVTGVERGILTQNSGYIQSKARQSKRMEALPTKIISPVWSHIFETLGYVRKSAEQPELHREEK